jgi:hypothetical protein
MADRVASSFPGRDAGCEIEPVAGGVESVLRFGDVAVKGVLDLEGAWKPCDELARVVSLVATGGAMERARMVQRGGGGHRR